MKKSVFEMSCHRQLAKTKWKFKGPLIEQCSKAIMESSDGETYEYHFGLKRDAYRRYVSSLDVGPCKIVDPTTGDQYDIRVTNDSDRMFYESSRMIYLNVSPFVTVGLSEGIEFEDASPITKRAINRVALAFRAMAAHIVDNLCASFEIGVKLFEKDVNPDSLTEQPTQVSPPVPVASSPPVEHDEDEHDEDEHDEDEDRDDEDHDDADD